ncbi:MAG: hypothetical protein H6R12_2547 [Proteobacteria bacterium]|nr:hypothetical protein [Pseudomonadota bacterium]
MASPSRANPVHSPAMPTSIDDRFWSRIRAISRVSSRFSSSRPVSIKMRWICSMADLSNPASPCSGDVASPRAAARSWSALNPVSSADCSAGNQCRLQRRQRRQASGPGLVSPDQGDQVLGTGARRLATDQAGVEEVAVLRLGVFADCGVQVEQVGTQRVDVGDDLPRVFHRANGFCGALVLVENQGEQDGDDECEDQRAHTEHPLEAGKDGSLDFGSHRWPAGYFARSAGVGRPALSARAQEWQALNALSSSTRQPITRRASPDAPPAAGMR